MSATIRKGFKDKKTLDARPDSSRKLPKDKKRSKSKFRKSKQKSLAGQNGVPEEALKLEPPIQGQSQEEQQDMDDVTVTEYSDDTVTEYSEDMEQESVVQPMAEEVEAA